MLNLQAGVHFHEVELIVGIEQELNRACTNVVYRLGSAHCGFTHFGTGFGTDGRRRRFFNYFLMAALH